MGYRIDWIAVRGKSLADVCGDLALRQTGEFDEYPEGWPVLCALAKSGWLLLFLNDFDPPDDEGFAQLSTESQVLWGSVNETVMCSSCESWRDGEQKWAVEYDCGRDERFRVHGELPPQFIDIRNRLMAKQAEEDSAGASVDYLFDAPIELGESFTGFRYDGELESESEAPWERLETLTPSKGRRWWQLFGA